MEDKVEARYCPVARPGYGAGVLMAAAGGRPCAASLRVAAVAGPRVGGKQRPAAASTLPGKVARCGHSGTDCRNQLSREHRHGTGGREAGKNLENLGKI